MHYPKVIFKKMSLEENIEYIKWSYSIDSNLMSPHYYTLQYFPELRNIKEDEINSTIEQVVSTRYNEQVDIINIEVERYSKLWEPYNDKYCEVLCNYLNSSFKEELDTIEVHVGLMPVNPRNIEKCSFDLDINMSDEQLIGTCAHELCHFVWFNKWKELYPDISEEEYDDGIVWQYSEIVVDPILNSNNINDILKIECRAYDNFYKMMDDDKLVIDNLRDIYNTNDTIENKIINGYEYIKSILENKIRNVVIL